MFDTIVQTINYVTNAPFFYQTMGITAATSIFVGASIYNGDVKNLSKGIITLGTYCFLLVLMTITRVVSNLNIETPYKAYASLVTIIFLTIWYILGMVVGVYIVQKSRKRKK